MAQGPRAAAFDSFGGDFVGECVSGLTLHIIEQLNPGRRSRPVVQVRDCPGLVLNHPSSPATGSIIFQAAFSSNSRLER
jgi:hypothetical protein